jgi:hypothetical protein
LQQRNVADDDFRTVAPPPAAVVDEVVDDDATAVLKRERLRALAARDAVRRTNRR